LIYLLQDPAGAISKTLVRLFSQNYDATGLLIRVGQYIFKNGAESLLSRGAPERVAQVVAVCDKGVIRFLLLA
jgi:hypothetical protein